MAIRDEFDAVTRNGEEMILLEDNSNNIKWEKAVEKTITGNGKIEFTGNRNRAVKEILFEGFCQQDGTPSPDDPKPIKINDSVWETSPRWNQLVDQSGKSGSNASVDTIEYISLAFQYYTDPYTTFFSNTVYTPQTIKTIIAPLRTTPCRLFHSGRSMNKLIYIVNMIANHKYVLYIDITGSNPSVIGGMSWDNLQLIDLTDIFGAGGEPSTVAEFEAWAKSYGKDLSQYQPYNAGGGMFGSVDLSGIQLAGVGDVKDTFDAVTGAMTGKIGKITLNSSMNISLYSYAGKKGIFANNILPVAENRAAGIGTHESNFIGYNPSLNSTIWIGVGSKDFFWVGVLDVLSISTIEEFKDWLDEQDANGTPVTIYYVLAEPVTEQLTPQPITQHKGTNTITQVSGSVSNTAATAKIYGFPYESVSLKFAQHAVNSHIAKDLIPIGTELPDTWRTYDAPWRVAHHFAGGNAMALEWKWCTPDGEVFDAPEAIYYAADGLAAGTYNITIGLNMGTGWVKGQSIQFTLAKAVPAGGQIYIDCGTNQNNNPTAGRTLTVYTTKGGMTVNETTTTSNGTAGTNLGSTSTAHVGRTNGYINAQQRVVYGYNRWSQSSKRQWLNATGNKNTWWTAQNDWDRPPAEAATKAGFLYDCSPEFVSILTPTNVVTALNTTEGFTETYEITEDKIFLPSLQEMYINPQLANVEGEDWLYYKKLAAENGLTGRIPTGTALDWMKKYRVDNHNSAAYVFLRSASRSNSCDVWYVFSSGGVYTSTAYGAHRACPACILHDETYQPILPTEIQQDVDKQFFTEINKNNEIDL